MGGSRVRRTLVRIAASASDDSKREDRSKKGSSYEQGTRRRGRPAWKRSPYDTPLRDGNRDRLIGLVTDRAARMLCTELSLGPDAALGAWFLAFVERHPIPRDGAWDDVSGEAFLRALLTMDFTSSEWDAALFGPLVAAQGDPVEVDVKLDADEDVPRMDPRALALRVMELRAQVAADFTAVLGGVKDANAELLREVLQRSLEGSGGESTSTSTTEKEKEKDGKAEAEAGSEAVSKAPSAAATAATDGKDQGPAKGASKDAGAANGKAKGETKSEGDLSQDASPTAVATRKANSERIIGLLTDRASKTLAYYLMETNPTLCAWWTDFLRVSRITWDQGGPHASGEIFLRRLFSMNLTTASWGEHVGMDEMYRNFGAIAVDPRQMAQRVMDIRAQLAKEFIDDLSNMEEENAILYREALQRSFQFTVKSMDDLNDLAGGKRA